MSAMFFLDDKTLQLDATTLEGDMEITIDNSSIVLDPETARYVAEYILSCIPAKE